MNLIEFFTGTKEEVESIERGESAKRALDTGYYPARERVGLFELRDIGRSVSSERTRRVLIIVLASALTTGLLVIGINSSISDSSHIVNSTPTAVPEKYSSVLALARTKTNLPLPRAVATANTQQNPRS